MCVQKGIDASPSADFKCTPPPDVRPQGCVVICRVLRVLPSYFARYKWRRTVPSGRSTHKHKSMSNRTCQDYHLPFLFYLLLDHYTCCKTHNQLALSKYTSLRGGQGHFGARNFEQFFYAPALTIVLSAPPYYSMILIISILVPCANHCAISASIQFYDINNINTSPLR